MTITNVRIEVKASLAHLAHLPSVGAASTEAEEEDEPVVAEASSGDKRGKEE